MEYLEMSKWPKIIYATNLILFYICAIAYLVVLRDSPEFKLDDWVRPIFHYCVFVSIAINAVIHGILNLIPIESVVIGIAAHTAYIIWGIALLWRVLDALGKGLGGFG